MILTPDRSGLTALFLALCLSAVLMGQAEPQEPEVRRALPVASPLPSDSLLSGGTTTPVRVMKAIPAASSPVSGETSTGPATATGGSIRIGASVGRDSESLATAQLAVADGFFARKQPMEAIAEYEKFLVMATKQTPGREHAIYRLGESQRLMGNNGVAETTFLKVTEADPKSPQAAAAWFRIGELREARGYLDGAAAAFASAAGGTTESQLGLTARYRCAVCLQKTGQKEESSKLLKEVAETQGENPQRIPALMQLAASAAQAGDNQAALQCYARILEEGSTGEIAAEAAVKSAVIQSGLGSKDAALKLFEKAAAAGNGRWSAAGELGALKMASEGGQYETVLKTSEKALAANPENRAEILLLRAVARRKLGKNAQALDDYDAIIREFPTSKAAEEASFQRLLSLHALRNDKLAEEIDHYLLTCSDPTSRAKARLLKAEETVRLGKFREAAALYHDLPLEFLSPDSHADIRYKEAWSLIRAGDQSAAITALSRFLEKHPDDPRAAAALAQRGYLKQQQSDFDGALADYSKLLSSYPKSPEGENALRQKALLLGQKQDNRGMVDSFREFLEKYPGSPSAPQAHYWIGWAAFEEKDYPTSLTELSKARAGDPKQFGERVGMRLLLVHYYADHPVEASREAAALKPSLIPPEVGRWLGMKSMEAGEAAKAERFLAPLVGQGLPGAKDLDIQSTLAAALVAQGKFREAAAPASEALKLAKDPASRAKALLVSASIQKSLKNLREASSLAEEALLLQPEGPVNAEGRILSGDIMMSKQDFTGAAKAYMTVAVLNDDPEITPKALARAADAYRRAGLTDEARKALDELSQRFPKSPAPSPPQS